MNFFKLIPHLKRVRFRRHGDPHPFVDWDVSAFNKKLSSLAVDCPVDNLYVQWTLDALDMTTGQQNIKINTLQERYRLGSKQAVYDRINGLNIKPINKGEVSIEQLDLLDALDKFLKENPTAAIADFPKQPVVEAVITRLEKDYEVEDQNTINLLGSLVEKLVLARLDKPSALEKYRELDEAVLSKWILPTSTVVELIGVSPRGKIFVHGSFVFNKIGKIGRQAGWLVTSHSALPEELVTTPGTPLAPHRHSDY